MTISAELKKVRDAKEEGRVIRSERQYGFASRSFTLSCAVDEAKADAKMHDGVLKLTLPEKTTTSSRRFAIA